MRFTMEIFMFQQFMKGLAEARKNPMARKGMTLIEIMIVVTLMVAIMGLIGFNVIGQADKANAGLAETQLKQLKDSCNMYRIQNKKFPEKLDDLVDKGVIEEVPMDPWDNEYVFEKTGNKIKMYSNGADGLPNTEDDIVVNIG